MLSPSKAFPDLSYLAEVGQQQKEVGGARPEGHLHTGDLIPGEASCVENPRKVEDSMEEQQNSTLTPQ